MSDCEYCDAVCMACEEPPKLTLRQRITAWLGATFRGPTGPPGPQGPMGNTGRDGLLYVFGIHHNARIVLMDNDSRVLFSGKLIQTKGPK